MQKNQLTLETVANNLKLWRAAKSNPQTRIPQNIKDSIKAISKNYTYQQLSRALLLYGSKLTNIIGNKNTKNNSVDFVEIPTTSSQIPESHRQLKISTPYSCTIQHPNGSTLSIEIPTQQLLSTIIKDFICCK
jgi:hypothetical protein